MGKGQNALELAIALEDNLTLPDTAPAENPHAVVKADFNIPSYFNDAIEWLCQ